MTPTPDAEADPGGSAEGALVIVDKPAGWTSHDVVAKSRGILGTRKIGHAGTLDPDATGLLLLGVGTVTRLLRFLTMLPKSYTCEVVLGTATSTLDSSGDVTASFDMTGVSDEDVRAAARGFVGPIMQVPPMVSAVKVGGQRLHALARQGIEVEREARPVTVHSLDIEPTSDPLVYRMRVECSSGTYVRTLAADIGEALGGGAHLRALRRTAIGSFTEAEARPLEDPLLLTPAEAMRDMVSVSVDDATSVLISHGRVLDRSALAVEGDGPWAVLGPDGALLAVYEPRGAKNVKPAVVLSRT